jgi:diphthine methyl ester acylhydrolase
MLEIETIQMFDTKYSADSVEWCSSSPDRFVVGTYQLEKKDENVSSNNLRKGRIYLFHFDYESNQLKECQRIETDAILDQKWNGNFLLTATSSGIVQKHELNDDNQLEEVTTIQLTPEESQNLALSIDVDEDSSKVLASDSKGKISLLDFAAQQPIVRQWKAHNFEAWTCAFDRFNENVVHSGGDDSVAHVWDLRMDSDEVLKIKSATRDAGVTSFLSYKENLLLIGSYDEKLCVHDLRNLKRPVDEINLCGGIWRIKSSPFNANHLLVACMYHNFSIVNCTNELKLIGEYFGHDSICYGCDWSRKSQQVFASCSFYDHKLSICRVKF